MCIARSALPAGAYSRPKTPGVRASAAVGEARLGSPASVAGSAGTERTAEDGLNRYVVQSSTAGGESDAGLFPGQAAQTACETLRSVGTPASVGGGAKGARMEGSGGWETKAFDRSGDEGGERVTEALRFVMEAERAQRDGSAPVGRWEQDPRSVGVASEGVRRGRGEVRDGATERNTGWGAKAAPEMSAEARAARIKDWSASHFLVARGAGKLGRVGPMPPALLL